MDVFDAMADPVRRDLLRVLAVGPTRVVDLAAGRAISRPAVSKHLRVLTDAGLVVADDLGRERHYRLRPKGVERQWSAWSPTSRRYPATAGRPHPSPTRPSTPSTSRCAGSAVTGGPIDTTTTSQAERAGRAHEHRRHHDHTATGGRREAGGPRRRRHTSSSSAPSGRR